MLGAGVGRALKGAELSLWRQHFKVGVALEIWRIRSLGGHVQLIGIGQRCHVGTFHGLNQSIKRSIRGLLSLTLFFQLFLLLCEPGLISFRFLFMNFWGVGKLLIDGAHEALLEFVLCLSDWRHDRG